MLINFIHLIFLDYGDTFVEIIKNACDHTQKFNNYVSNYRNQVNSLNYSFILDDKIINGAKFTYKDLHHYNNTENVLKNYNDTANKNLKTINNFKNK